MAFEKLKAKLVANKLRSTLFMKIKKSQLNVKYRRTKCLECQSKFDELSKKKYSDSKAYDMICENYLCSVCTPIFKEYYELMMPNLFKKVINKEVKELKK